MMYESFYQLSGKPFRLSPDPQFFYGSRGHRRAMSYLRYGLSKGEGFIIITGAVGTGKTTLVKNLFAELDTKKMVAAQLVTTQLNQDEVLGAVCAAFGLPTEGLAKADLLKRLEVFLEQNHAVGKRTLLVVDEVQNLPLRSLEELRMLSNFQHNENSLLQSFLLGQAEFRDMLVVPELEQLRQRVIASYHLEPFGEEETRYYVLHRLKTVGWSNKPKFIESAFHEIHHWSGGVPRRINVLCDRLLLFGFLEENDQISDEMVLTVAKELSNETPGVVEDSKPKGSTPSQNNNLISGQVRQGRHEGEITDIQTELVGKTLRGTMKFEIQIDSIDGD